MAENDPFADLPDAQGDTAVADDPFADLPKAPSRLARAVDTAVDIADQGIRRGIDLAKTTGPLAPIVRIADDTLNLTKGMDERQRRQDQARGIETGTYAQGDVRAGALGAMRREDIARDKEKAKKAPAYRNRREAIDDAVNLLDEGADATKVFDRFAAIGIKREEIEAEAGRRAPAGPPQTFQPQEPESAITGTIGEPKQGRIARGIDTAATSLRRGAKQAQSMGEVIKTQLPGGSPEVAATRIAEINRTMPAYSDDVSAAIEKMAKSKTMGEAVAAAAESPGAFLAVLAESVVASSPSLLAVPVGMLGGPGAAAATAGVTSYAMEFGSSVQDYLTEKGMNPRDPRDIHRALTDPALMAEARDFAARRGVPVAAFDAMSAGIAGKVLGPVVRRIEQGTLKGAKAVGAAGAATIAEAGIQGGLGAAGELGGQYVSGQEYDPFSALAEFGAEFISAPKEVATNILHAARAKQGAEPAAADIAGGPPPAGGAAGLVPVETPEGPAFRTPNGATITQEQWDNASPRVREGWMQPAAEGEQAPTVPRETEPSPEERQRLQVAADVHLLQQEAGRLEREAARLSAGGEQTNSETLRLRAISLRERAAKIEKANGVSEQLPTAGGIAVDEEISGARAPLEPTERMQELERLAGVTQDPTVKKDLLLKLKAERQAQEQALRDEETAAAYERTALETEDQALAAELKKKAASLRKTEKPSTRGIQVQEVAAEEVELKAAGEVERRKDTATRKKYEQMSPEELRKELLTSPVTAMPNRRAYDEAPKRAVQTSIDVDSLKWVNDNMGHPAGDEMLRKVGEAIKESGAEGFHLSGDEFVIQSDTPEQAAAAMRKIRKVLASASVSHTLPDGSVITKKGIDLSHGSGRSVSEAESKLRQHKAERARRGVRSERGAEPKGVDRQAPGPRQETRGAGVGAVGRVPEGTERGNAPTEINTTPLWLKRSGLTLADAPSAAKIRTALAADQAAVMRAAEQNPNDEAAFMRAVQEIIDASAQEEQGADVGRRRADDVAAPRAEVRRAEAGGRQPDDQETRPGGQETARDVQQDGQPSPAGADVAARSRREQPRAERDQASGDLASRSRREQMSWEDVELGERGDVFVAGEFMLDPVRELEVGTGFGGELMLGHAANVAPGNRVVRYQIAGRDGRALGRVDLQLDPQGNVVALHDISVQNKGQGVGRQVVGSLLANFDNLQILDIVPTARTFWEKLGVGAIDVYGNATLDWSSFARATARQSGGVSPEGRRGGAQRAAVQRGPQARQAQQEDLAALWYSPLQRAIEALPAKAAKASPQAWLNTLTALGQKGVRADEIEWSGVREWLGTRTDSVTRDEVLRFLRDNGVKVGERWFGANIKEMAKQKRDYLFTVYEKEQYDRLDRDEISENEMDTNLRDFNRALEKAQSDPEFYDALVNVAGWTGNEAHEQLAEADESALALSDSPQYSRYVIPGGKNYRELLLTLPSSSESADKQKLLELLTEHERISDRQLAVSKYGYDELDPDQFLHGYRLKDLDSVVYLIEMPNGRFFVPTPEGGHEFQRLNEAELYLARWASDEFNLNQIPDDDFQSSHWGVPNVIAHIRFDERIDVDGKRVMFVEEYQSDWAQIGRRSGFRKPSARPKLPTWFVTKDGDGPFSYTLWYPTPADSTNRSTHVRWGVGVTAEHAIERARSQRGDVPAEVPTLDMTDAEVLVATGADPVATGVPPAPFVQKTKDWTALAVKRVIRYAAENGFDRVAWTTGDQQNDRYNLRKQVDAVGYYKWPDGKYDLRARKKGGIDMVPIVSNISADKLDDYVGKELAEKIRNGQGSTGKNGWKTFRGMDLQIGGQPMRSFYGNPEGFEVDKDGNVVLDKNGKPQSSIIASVTNDVLRKIGGEKVKPIGLMATAGSFGISLERLNNGDWRVLEDGVPYGTKPTYEEAEAVAAKLRDLKAQGLGNQPGFDITPRMRELAAQGMPMFSRRAAPRLGLGEQLASVRAALDDAFGADLIDALIRDGILRLEPSWQNRRPLAADPTVRAIMSEHDERGAGASLFIDRIRAADAPALLMHEIGEHYGMPRMLGQDGYQKLLDGIRRAFMRNDAETRAAWDLVKRDYTNDDGTMMVPEGSDNFVREVAAAMIESAPERGWVREVLDAIRSWLARTFGVNVDKVDGNLLRGLAASALRQSAAGMLPRTSQFAADRAGSAAIDPSSKAFQRWFGDSKVVDENGKPLEVYHGTDSETQIGRFRVPAYFSDKAGFSEAFGQRAIYPVYLKIERPNEIDGTLQGRHFEWDKEDVADMKRAGYDGVIVTHPDGNVYTVFDQSQIKSSIGNRGTFDPNDPSILASRSMSLEADRISPRAPTAVKRAEDPMAQELQPDLQTMMRNREVFLHNLKLLTDSPDIRVDRRATPERQAEQVIAHFQRNLEWLFDHYKDFVDRSKLWYVGGNRIAHQFADRFGIEPRQAAGVMAALSPQKDWFQNVSLAERFLSAVYEHPDDPWIDGMDNVLATRDWGKGLSRGEKDRIRGKTLRQVWGSGSAEELLSAAHWIRAWDEATNPNKARVISPEGNFMDWDVAKNGEPIKMRASSFKFYTKALVIMADGSRESISRVIGADHKVRSFYNNLIAPYSTSGDVTIDTHAVAAAHLLPQGSSDDLVKQAFGGGNPGRPASKSSDVTGLMGNYAFYAEAYRRAAAAKGVLPREMQSVTWEAVRGLFRPEQKVALKGSVAKIWERYGKGEIDENQAREETLQVAGGVAPPKWAGSSAGRTEVTRASSYAEELPQTVAPGGGATSDSVGPDGRGAAGTSTEDLAARSPRLSPETNTSWTQNAYYTPLFNRYLREQQFVALKTQRAALRAGASRAEASAAAERAVEALKAAQKAYGFPPGTPTDTSRFYRAQGQTTRGELGSASEESTPDLASRTPNTPEFKRWFGDSKVVDEQGKPLVVYHGTNFRFSAFDQKKVDSTGGAEGGSGFYFSSDKAAASSFGDKVLSVYLSIKNPFVPGIADEKLWAKWSRLKDRNPKAATRLLESIGYDGIDLGAGEYVAFRPEQIKSTFNRGTFDPQDEDVLAAKGPRSRAMPQPPVNSSQLDAETNFQLLQRKFFDRFNRVRQLQRERRPGILDEKNVVQADTLYYGRAQYEGEELERRFIEPLGEALKAAKKIGLTVRDADDYLMAKHAPERNRVIAARNPNMPDGGSGLTNLQAANILSSFNAQQTAALDRVAQIVYRMNEDRLLRSETSGLISPQFAQLLRQQYSNYVPLKTLDEEDAAMGVGRGYELRNSGIEMAFGRQSKAGSPIASSIMDAARTVIMAEKAKVDRVIWNLANDPDVVDVMTPVDDGNAAQHFSRQRLNPTTRQVETIADPNWRNRDDVVKLRVDGEERYVWVRDDLLRDQLRKVATLADPGPVLRSLGRVTSTIGRLLTEFNPAFTLPNAVRDAIGGVIKSNGIERVSPARVLAGIPAAWKAIVDFKRDANTPGARMYREFQEDGAKTGAYGITDVGDTMHRLERLGAELGYAGRERGISTKLMHGLNDLAKFIGHANEVVEYATRLSLYAEARRAKYTRKQAAVWAKELTVNFNRSGEYGRTLNSIFVFANAALQGLYGAIMFGKSNKVKAALLGMVVLGAITQAFNEAYGGDDEDTGEKNVNTLSDHTLDNNATVLIPGSASGIKIPLPPEFSFLYAMGRRAYRAMTQGNYAKEAGGIVGAFLGSTLPLRAPDASSTPLSVMKALTPTAVSPFMDIAVNEDFRGAPIVPHQRDKEAPQPWPVLARPQTSDVSKAIADFVNTATGGDRIEPGAAQKAFGPFASPEAMDHVVGFYTGGLGQFALQSKNIAKAVAGDEKAAEINRIPIANRFIFTQPQGYVGRRYRELASDFQYAIARQREGTTERVAPEVFAALPAYRGAERQLGPLFKQLRSAAEEGDKAREEELRSQIRAVQSTVLKAYNEARAQ